MKQILAIPGTATDADCHRVADFAAFLRRLAAAEAGGEAPVRVQARLGTAEALALLSRTGRLAFGADSPVTVWYVPSPDVRGQVHREGALWPEAIHKKQQEAFRSSAGAVLAFPVEGTGEQVAVFITDWSPSPVAGAVAVHRHHPLAIRSEVTQLPCFTGTFVRHPLTGDLLPVWVADWVRPEFGTGAVLVNPAHDQTDLAFARAVGLPIRFGLVPESYTGHPDTWLTPPIIKTGRTAKTGLFDGHTVDEAMAHYFQLLDEYGFAKRHVDLQVGKWHVATLVPDPEGEALWCERCGKVLLRGDEPCHGTPRAVRIQTDPVLQTVLALAPGTAPTLVAPAAEQKSSLLFIRLLARELFGEPLAPAAVHLINKVQPAQGELSPEIARMGAHTAAAPGQVAVVRQQAVDQVTKLVETHREFSVPAAPTALADDAAGPLGKALRAAKAAVMAEDPFKAFGLLYQLAKQLRSIPPDQRLAASVFGGYFAVAYVLLGLPYPAGLDVNEAWRQI